MAIEVISAAVALLLAGLWRGSLREVLSDEAHWGRRWRTPLAYGVRGYGRCCWPPASRLVRCPRVCWWPC